MYFGKSLYISYLSLFLVRCFLLPKVEPPLNLLGAPDVEPGKANYDPELTGMG